MTGDLIVTEHTQMHFFVNQQILIYAQMLLMLQVEISMYKMYPFTAMQYNNAIDVTTFSFL